MFLAIGSGAAAGMGIRGGDHPGYGRIVLDLPEGVTATASQEGDRITVSIFGDPGPDGTDAGQLAARNLRRALGVAPGLELTVAHGARLRTTRLNGRLVLDLLDPPRPQDTPAGRSTRPPTPEARTTPLPAPAAASADLGPELIAPSPRAAALVSAAGGGGTAEKTRVPPPPQPETLNPRASPLPPIVAMQPANAVAIPIPESPRSTVLPSSIEAAGRAREPIPALPGNGASLGPSVEPVQRTDLPAQGGAARSGLALAATGNGNALSLPFSATTGAAAFVRGDWSYVVFDERRPIDLASERDNPAFADATVRLLPDATLLRLRTGPRQGLALAHDGATWTVTLGGAAADAFVTRPAEGGVLLGTTQAGRVVAMQDPDAESILLVGTLRRQGQAVSVMRRATAFILWPTLLGVVAEPTLDSVRMRAVKEGFLLVGGVGQDLGLSPGFLPAEPASVPDGVSRMTALSSQPVPVLVEQWRAASQVAAAAPAGSRTEPRLALARSLVALGLGAEAMGVTTAIARDDPRAASRPEVVGLTAVAALLAGRVGEGDGVIDQQLAATAEGRFWLAIRAAMLGQDVHAAAAALSPNVPLFISYPAPLRDRLMAVVGETLAEGGQAGELGQLVKAFPDEPRLALAVAMTAEAGGPGLAGLDALARGSDRRARVRAARLMAETRLARGLADPAQTADALARLIYAWREDGPEIALRRRVAELRAQGGAPRQALGLLRETVGLWPEEATRLRAAMSDILEAAVAPDARPILSPLDLVTLVEENADLVRGGPAAERLAEMLADRLAGLELQQRAEAAFDKLARQAAPGPARATLGMRLAALRLSRDDDAGALAALRESVAPDLPPALVEARELLRARAQASQRDRPAALATLAPLSGPAVAELRADLLEQSKDWAGAGQALATVLDGLPPAGALEETQARLVLRAASDAAQGGDETRLRALRQQFQDRLKLPDLARMFALLTAAPVRETADLARAGRELALAHALPTQLDALASNHLDAR